MTLGGAGVGVNADVIDEHFVRELRVIYFKSGPVSTYSNVQQEKLRLMECFGSAGVVFDGHFVVLEIIDIHGDEFFVPSEFVRVELRDVQFLFCSMEIACAVAVAGVLPFVLPVVGAVDNALVVDGFDDIDFPAGGPTHFIDVFSEHPEGRPNSLTYGERDAGLDCAVGECELALGNHARRSVAGAFIIFLVGADVEDAVLHVGVFFAPGVVFLLVVAPAATARTDFECPLGGVYGGTVELVVPEVRRFA